MIALLTESAVEAAQAARDAAVQRVAERKQTLAALHVELNAIPERVNAVLLDGGDAAPLQRRRRELLIEIDDIALELHALEEIAKTRQIDLDCAAVTRASARCAELITQPREALHDLLAMFRSTVVALLEVQKEYETRRAIIRQTQNRPADTKIPPSFDFAIGCDPPLWRAINGFQDELKAYERRLQVAAVRENREPQLEDSAQ
jgi:hypothetical protein